MKSTGRLSRVSVLLCSAVCVANLGAQPAAAPRTEVPVRTVMLFSSGVGYFEHAGQVRGDAATELRFKTTQINDILKSLVVRDQDGGRVSAITYPSQDPIAKTLRSFQVDITRNPSLSELLNQLRGANVTVQIATDKPIADKVSGVVLGVEIRRSAPVTTVSPSGVLPSVGERQVLNILSGANIKSVDLATISNVSLDDVALQDELSKALSALSQSRDQDKKPVTIGFTGSGDRRVRIGYVVETPIWKTSYRLLMDEKVTALQGWAIVENQTESDWSDVQLSLVSGRPISFQMNLYQPLYATRPTVTPQLFAGLRPQVYDAGIAAERASQPMNPLSPAPPSGYASDTAVRREQRLAGGLGGRMALSAVVVQGNAASLVESVAAARRMGELFQYTVPHVSLARQKSAMLPIVSDTVSVERVSIYNESVQEQHPLNGVRLHNNTGKHLLEGPLTVLDKGAYAGDAQIDNIPPGQQRLLSYGIDLDVLVTATNVEHNGTLMTGRILNGLLTLDYRTVSTHEYRADHQGTREKTLIIEHPRDPERKLIDTQKPIETTSDRYRFQGKLAPGKVTTLVVKEESITSSAIALVNSDIAQLIAVAKETQIPASIREALTKLAAFKRAIADSDRQIAEQTRQIAEITQEQNRIRENMRTVQQNAAYYQRLLEKLNEQESRIEALQREKAEALRVKEGRREEMEGYVRGLAG